VWDANQTYGGAWVTSTTFDARYPLCVACEGRGSEGETYTDAGTRCLRCGGTGRLPGRDETDTDTDEERP
jgi:hypothetical protein